MPNSCIVPNCKTNYRSSDEKHTVFLLPKNNELRNLWLQKIPRKNFIPSKYSAVCEKHFNASDIIREDKVVRDDGSVLIVKRDRPKLKTDAVPVIFPNCPKYLSSEPKTKRTNLDVRENLLLQRAIEESKQSHSQYLQESIFNSFEKLVELLNNKGKYWKEQFANWDIIFHKECVLFAELITDPIPKINKVLKINKNLIPSAFYGDSLIVLKCLKHLPVINSVHHISECLNEMNELTRASNNFKSFVDNISKTFKYALQEELVPYDKIKKVTFLMEQVELMTLMKNKIRYSNQTLLWCIKLLMQSSSSYKQLYESEIITIPHYRNLQKIINQRSIKSVHKNPLQYIEVNVNLLKDFEKIVVLQMDEIHINSLFSYKGGSIIGGSSVNSNKNATSVHALLISSLMSSYRDIVRLIPVETAKAEYLYEIVKATIIDLEKISVKVIAIVSDNNSINRKIFKQFSSKNELEISVPNPAIPSRPLFFLLDSVHLLKSIRNNWINKKDELVSFIFPDFSDTSCFNVASFKVLRSLFALENKNIVKCAYKLTLKSLYPSNIERQNVQLALQIFNENNVAALKTIENFEILGGQSLCINTSNFIEIILKWWKIFNIKSPKKGVRLNDDWQKPFSSLNDERFIFLDKFSEWLDIWHNTAGTASLTNETYTALSHSTKVMKEIITYLLNFEEIKFNYILPGKFQSDLLEQRFSQYRQMSGGNYHVSLQQILESERKLSLYTTLKIGNENLNLRKLNDLDKDKFTESADVTKYIIDNFSEIMNEEINLNTFDNNMMKACVYIAGYIAFKLKRKFECSFCTALLSSNKLLDIEDVEYYELITITDRGKLSYPSEFLCQVLCYCVVILNILTTSSMEKKFLEAKIDQKLLLVGLTELKLITDDIFDAEEICICKQKVSDLVRNALLIASNILLGNYVKCKNQNTKKRSKSVDNRKVKKFQNIGQTGQQ